MSWHRLAALNNKQVKPEKIDLAAEYVSSIIAHRQDQLDIESIEFALGTRPDGMLGPEFLWQTAQLVGKRLQALGILDWHADLEKSHEASKVPNTDGYINTDNRIWTRKHNQLVLVHAPLAEVIYLPQIASAEPASLSA